jgi:DNA-binding transcriptional MerR regulator
MKTENNYISRAEMIAIAREAGCQIEEQASYLKVSRDGSEEQLLYVAKTERVARVDLSGFELKEPGVARYLGGEKFGRVHYQLRFDLPVENIKIHFRKLCEGLGKWVSLPRSKRGRPVGLKGSKKLATPMVVVRTEETPQQTIDRLVAELAKKRALANEIGAPLSKKTEKEYNDKIEEQRKRLETLPSSWRLSMG